MSNQFNVSSFWKCVFSAASVAAIAMSSLPPMAAAQTLQSLRRRHDPPHERSVTTLKIVSPQNGAVMRGDSFKLTIQVGAEMELRKLKITLNGLAVNSRRYDSACSGNHCTVNMTLSDVNGLRQGNNRLRADIAGKDSLRLDTRTSDFQMDETGQLGVGTSQVIPYTPNSLGFTTVENGGNGKPWVTVTTGQPAGSNLAASYPPLTDPNSSNTYSTAFPESDTSFTTDCSGTTYQTVVLNRSNPDQLEASSCSNSVADMENDVQTQLDRPLGANDLIVFGTTPYKFALPNLDTSDIGGTNWTKATAQDSSWYPAYYIIAGVKGAAPGTAHENLLASPHSDTPYTWGANLSGSLVEDSSGYFNYIPGNEKTFQAISGSNPTITIGSTTYTPPAGSNNGFWLLVVDPVYLQPINTYTTYPSPFELTTNCGWAAGSTSCGYFFPMDDNNNGGANAMAMTLGQVSPENLIFVVSVGCPFVNPTGLSQAVAGPALQQIGGLLHSVSFMNSTSKGCRYALASKRDGNHIVLGSHAALSWNYFAAQGQLGAIHGNLAKDYHGFYDFAGQDQMVMDQATNTLKPGADYAFENQASNVRADWPYTDNPESLMAYADISNQLLSDPSVGVLGSHNYDVRWYYTDQERIMDKLNDLIDSRLDPKSAGPTLIQPSSWDTDDATDFANVRAEIENEVRNADSLSDYLSGADGNGGVRGVLNGNNNNFLTTAIKVANDVGQDANIVNARTTDFSAATADWMNLGAGLLTASAAALGPEGPEAVGIMSGLLTTGSAAGTPLAPSTGTDPQVISGPSTEYDNSLTDLVNNADQYANNFLHSYDGFMDALLSDSTKLNVAGALQRTPNSGWQIPSGNSLDYMSSSFTTGAKTSLWIGELGKLYGVRQAIGMNTEDANKLGTKGNLGLSCDTAYFNVPSDAYTVYPDLNNTGTWDLNIFAEGPMYKGSSISTVDDTPVSQQLADVLTTNQTVTWSDDRTEVGLNLPRMQLYTDPPMTLSGYAQINPGGSACTDITNN